MIETPEYFVHDLMRGDAFLVRTAIIDHYLPKIGVYGLAVYCLMLRHSENGASSMSHGSLAKEMRSSAGTIKTEISRLMSLGLLSVRSGQIEGSPNVYFVMPIPLPGSRPDAPPMKEKEELSGLVFHPDGRVEGELRPTLVARRGGVDKLRPTLICSEREAKGVAKLRPTPSTCPDLPPSQIETEGVDKSAILFPEIPPPSNASFKDTTKTKTTAKTDRENPAVELTEEQLAIAAKFSHDLKALIDAIDRAYKAANPSDVTCRWGSRPVGQLKKLLAGYGWSVETWQKCIRNRFDSDGIIPGDPPENWIPKLAKYVSHPLNKFGNGPKEIGNGNVSARTQRNRTNLSEVLDWIDGLRPGEGQDEASSGGGDGNGRSDGY